MKLSAQKSLTNKAKIPARRHSLSNSNEEEKLTRDNSKKEKALDVVEEISSSSARSCVEGLGDSDEDSEDDQKKN